MPSESAVDGADRRRGGRPRDEARRAAILAAAGDLMLEGGLSAATMEAIAGRAGVSKQTIYNWWPSRGAVAMEGFMLRADPLGQVPDGVPAAEALRILAVELVRLFTSPAGALMRSLVAEAQSQPELADALRDQWLTPRRGLGGRDRGGGDRGGGVRARHRGRRGDGPRVRADLLPGCSWVTDR